MKKYRHLFFDLDGTLWDFVSNAEETQREMFRKFQLDDHYNSFESFFRIFQKYNDLLWIDYQKGKIKKEKLKWWRFYLCLKDVGVEEKSLAEDLDNYYLSEAPKKTKLIEGTIDLLNYLVPDYSLHIITNGFNEVQFLKLDNSKLTRFFQTIITSEDAGALKPDPVIFEYALGKAKAKHRESIMIGDVLEVDILGARSAGIDQVYFNPESVSNNYKPTFEVSKLEKIKYIL